MQKILFVCTGNTCRSPMAEAILQSMNIEGIEVKSAGLFAFDGAPISHHAQQVLQEHGIHFNHTAKFLSEEELKWADLILTMTKNHKDAILQQYPDLTDKVYTLKEYADDSGDVSDPYGGSLQTYQQTFQELQNLIKNVVKRLENN